MQRWPSITLAAYDYEIVFRNTSAHANADALSRLPSKVVESHKEDGSQVFHMEQLEALPITVTQIQTEIRKDPVLSKVYDCVMNGWKHNLDSLPELKPYLLHKDEISVQQNVLVWGFHTIIPAKFQQQVLNVLQEGHIGMTKMKSLARSFFWWPKIDQDIETLARNCIGCQQKQKIHGAAPLHPWEVPKAPWTRIHVDYAGPFLDHMFLVVMDATTKWPEVIMTKSTTSEWTVSALRTIFSRLGIPEQIVSDNGPQFRSETFASFVRKNGIKHVFSAPYHASTNGLAERLVQ